MTSIKVTPLAAESLGVRSLCTSVVTPDCRILLDPSAAVSTRNSLVPHPLEYRGLNELLARIIHESRQADLITVSHYHYDHIRPSFINYSENWSTPETTLTLYSGHPIFLKHPRENINPAQRRRAYFFQKFAEKAGLSITFSDNTILSRGETLIEFSPPFPHGVPDTVLGNVVCVRISYHDETVVFAPDVQGPLDKRTTAWILNHSPRLVLVGGPPLYLLEYRLTQAYLAVAQASLHQISDQVPETIVDHHLIRDKAGRDWLSLIETGGANRLLTCAEYLKQPIRDYEANRAQLYETSPPSKEFQTWSRNILIRKSTPPPLIDD